MSSYTRQYAWYTAWSLATTVLTGVLFYGVRIVLYGRLSVEAYAQFYSAMALVSMMIPVVSLGFDPGIVPFLSRRRESGDWLPARDTLMSAALVQTGFCVVAAIGLNLSASRLSPWLSGAPAALIAAFGIYLIAITLHKISLNGLLGLRHIVAKHAVESLRIIVCFAAIFLFVTSESSAPLTTWMYMGSAALSGAVGIALIVFMTPQFRSGRLRVSAKPLWPIMRDGAFAAIAFGGITIFMQLDTVMLSAIRLGDVDAVAGYQIAAPTFMIAQSLMIALANNMIPVIAAIDERGESDRLGRAVSRAYSVGILIILPASAMLAAVAEPLMRLLFGDALRNGPWALVILAVGSVFVYLVYLNVQILTGIGRTRQAAVGIIAALILNVAANALLIPRWSLAGAAASTVIANFVAMVLTSHAVSRSAANRPDGQSLAAAMLGAGVIWLATTQIAWIGGDLGILALGLGSYSIVIIIFMAIGLIPVREILPRRDAGS